MGRFSFLKEIICHFTGSDTSVAEATQTYETAHTLTVSSLVVDLDFRKRHIVSEIIGIYDRELASRIVNAPLDERDAIICEEISNGNLLVAQARELIDAGIVTSKCIPIEYVYIDYPFSPFMHEPFRVESFSREIESVRSFDKIFRDDSLSGLSEGFTEYMSSTIPSERSETYKRNR